MQSFLAIAALLATTALAAPATSQSNNQEPPYGPKHPVIDSQCPAPKPVNPPHFGPATPLCNPGPALTKIMGATTVRNMEDVAEKLCISSQQSGSSSLCPEIAGACQAFVDAPNKKEQSEEYGCLLHLLCVANDDSADQGMCNELLATADCVANTIDGFGGDCPTTES